MFGYKSVVAAVAVAAMISSSAFAADGALAPGKPAGVHKAEIGTGTLLLGLFGAAILTGVAITVGNQSGNNPGKQTFATATTWGRCALIGCEGHKY